MNGRREERERNIYLSDATKEEMIVRRFQLSNLSFRTRETHREREIVQLVELKMTTTIRIGRRNDELSLVLKRHQLTRGKKVAKQLMKRRRTRRMLTRNTCLALCSSRDRSTVYVSWSKRRCSLFSIGVVFKRMSRWFLLLNFLTPSKRCVISLRNLSNLFSIRRLHLINFRNETNLDWIENRWWAKENGQMAFLGFDQRSCELAKSWLGYTATFPGADNTSEWWAKWGKQLDYEYDASDH